LKKIEEDYRQDRQGEEKSPEAFLNKDSAHVGNLPTSTDKLPTSTDNLPETFTTDDGSKYQILWTEKLKQEFLKIFGFAAQLKPFLVTASGLKLLTMRA
jgi:hypothetical protein